MMIEVTTVGTTVFVALMRLVYLHHRFTIAVTAIYLLQEGFFCPGDSCFSIFLPRIHCLLTHLRCRHSGLAA